MKSKIKIAFVIDTVQGLAGGTEKQLMLLLEGLDRNSFEPYICCLKDPEWLRANSPCPVHEIGFHSFFKPGCYLNLFRFARFLRKENIRIVQTFFRDGNIVGVLAAKLAGVRSIVGTRRNYGHWYTRRELFILKALNIFCDVFIVNSNAIKNIVMKLEGVPERKIEVIYNGINKNGAVKKRGNDFFREEFGLAIKGPVILSVANLRPVKRLDMLLKAAVYVLASFPDAHFIFLGEGEERGSLEELAKALGISGKVYFAGKSDHVREVLPECYLGVLSSDSEGLSNAIIEYMSAGLPVVCTDVGGNRELVRDGENGFLVPAGNFMAMAQSIKKILASGLMAKEMGEKARRMAEEKFSVAVYLKKSEEVFKGLAQEI